jgi:hypothetical protein
MRYISYSLWGDNELYNIGMVKNAEQVPKIYSGWQMIVYHDNSVPKETLSVLEDLNVKLVNVDGHTHGMFWRFFASDLVDCEYAIFRDGDSRLSIREKMAVDEWINSGKSLHVMRDHPAHGIPFGSDRLGILGGMWGIKSKVIPITDMIEKFKKDKNLTYGSDQTFLKTIYSIFESDRITHDEFYEKKPFPISREYGRFVGDRIDENNKPVGDDYKYVI